jgi:hypothetical protein
MELKERFFDTGEIKLHYMEGPNTRPPLVMLHGATGNWEAWNHLLPELTRRWHVFAPEFAALCRRYKGKEVSSGVVSIILHSRKKDWR